MTGGEISRVSLRLAWSCIPPSISFHRESWNTQKVAWRYPVKRDRYLEGILILYAIHANLYNKTSSWYRKWWTGLCSSVGTPCTWSAFLTFRCHPERGGWVQSEHESQWYHPKSSFRWHFSHQAEGGSPFQQSLHLFDEWFTEDKIGPSYHKIDAAKVIHRLHDVINTNCCCL